MPLCGEWRKFHAGQYVPGTGKVHKCLDKQVALTDKQETYTELVNMQ